jgi:hypothetical protein
MPLSLSHAPSPTLTPHHPPNPTTETPKPNPRSVNLPALQVTLDELLFHTQQIAQGRGIPLGEVSVKIDPHVRIVIGLDCIV